MWVMNMFYSKKRVMLFGYPGEEYPHFKVDPFNNTSGAKIIKTN
jgi:hypothetical protein